MPMNWADRSVKINKNESWQTSGVGCQDYSACFIISLLLLAFNCPCFKKRWHKIGGRQPLEIDENENSVNF